MKGQIRTFWRKYYHNVRWFACQFYLLRIKVGNTYIRKAKLPDTSASSKTAPKVFVLADRVIAGTLSLIVPGLGTLIELAYGGGGGCVPARRQSSADG
jgi:hypothetical protein